MADVKIPKMIFTSLLSALRAKQWIKNLLIFVPLVFSREFLNPDSVKLAAAAFGIFCATASGIYLLNDLLDRDSDKKHFAKKQRAIASGKLPLKIAAAASAILLITSLLLATKLNFVLAAIVSGYIFLQIVYSVFLKHIVIVDLLAISTGFILRIFAGGAVIGVEISNWLLTITFLLALLLAAGKRLREVESAGIFSRKVLEN
ncbi:UbiA family prenyltransferase, partial [Candidatus Gracilibacteria bacterium]|nr:UbiA family prenyltransferase [Candidatus Gracilibacteria bacterium]